MRTFLPIACLLWIGLAPCDRLTADEQGERPLSVEQVADVAEVLVRTDAADMLERLAARREPDPWRVAEILCQRGAFDAAHAYARAVPDSASKALRRYADARRTHDVTAARAAIQEASKALARGDHEAALAALARAAKEARDVPALMAAYGIGELLRDLGRRKEGHAAFAAAARDAERLGWLRLAASAWQNAGHLAFGQAELDAALDAWNHRRAVEERRGSTTGAAEARANMALVYKRRGRYPKAIAEAQRALSALEDAGANAAVAMTLANIGTMHRSLGDYTRALDYQERAHRLLQRLEGHAAQAAGALANLGNLHADLGNDTRALELLGEARRLLEAEGEEAQATRVAVGMAAIQRARGEPRQALDLLAVALRRLGQADDPSLRVTVLQSQGDIQADLGQKEAARASQLRALTLAEGLGDRERIADARIKLAVAEAALGRRAEAIAGLEQAVREADRLSAPHLLVGALTALAWIRRAEGRADLALAAARQAAPHVDDLVRGQDDESGARARAQYADLYAVGALAAADLGDAAEACHFLESGRAGALLESLEGRNGLRSTRLPEVLFEEELRARFALEQRLGSLARAQAKKDLPAGRAARKGVEEARDALRGVQERIERHAKTVAGLFYPRAETADEIRRRLRPDEAVVTYGLLPEESLAVVLTRAEARLVPLGRTSRLRELVRALDARDPSSNTGPATAALRAALVDPLQLDDAVRRLLVSPAGDLSYLPFALLAEDKEIVYVPSATTYLLLRDDRREAGRGVLALGDPDYRTHTDPKALALYAGGRPLAPLAATRKEARRVAGRSDDLVLLAADATKQRLRVALAERPRWRALHLACHGLVDPEQPMLSSLALSATPQDAGFLTVAEVFRMTVPADLVVLSACETGTGRIYKAEGIVGLTRAFMFAGSPRIVCSLWAVDDVATSALMIKFYELWNPKEGGGIGAAEALRQAQAHVREHPQHPAWKHPYYWAAWVLWGLPD